MQFIDLVTIEIESGAGGNGCLSFRRARNEPRGGPDGGNGGAGGSVIAECVEGLNTLVDFRFKQHFKAPRGHNGEGLNRTGADGVDVVLPVPVGTEILDAKDEEVLFDLINLGDRAILASGGRGGRGNASYKSSTNRAPRQVDSGETGVARKLRLRLKLLADVGLIGQPNAGKSTFLSVVSHARPKIANYPFTTLTPHLGVVTIDAKELVYADLPGLISGAHEGIGLGHRFLSHAERCKVILHLVDATENDVCDSYALIRNELNAYGRGISDKFEIICLTKIDSIDDMSRERKFRELVDLCGDEVFPISSVSGEGIEAVLRAIKEKIIIGEKDKQIITEQSFDPLTR